MSYCKFEYVTFLYNKLFSDICITEYCGLHLVLFNVSSQNCVPLGFKTCNVCKLIATLLIFSEVRVEGLETLDYLDNLKNRERSTEQGDAITFESEVSFCYKWSSFFC